MKDKINPTVSITLLFLFVIAGMYYYFDNKLRKLENDHVKTLKEQRELNEEAIDSLQNVVETAKAKIDSLESVKVELVEDLKPIKKKLKKYEERRFYADATFDTESKRIANSRYRYSQQDSTAGPSQSYRDWQNNPERGSPIPREQVAQGSFGEAGGYRYKPRAAT